MEGISLTWVLEILGWMIFVGVRHGPGESVRVRGFWLVDGSGRAW